MRGIKSRNTNRSRSLRKDATPAEQILWKYLRDRQINGRKWRRQHKISKYVVDFFCAELALVVELDGDVHAFQQRQDIQRQREIESQGIRVLRFTNQDVLENLDGVLETLWEMTK